MGNFEKLLKKIEACDGSVLNLIDYGLDNSELDRLVDALNNNAKIKVLYLQHNGLNDESTTHLCHLKHIESLNVSHNDLTSKGTRLLSEGLSKLHPGVFKLYAEQNRVSYVGEPEGAKSLLFATTPVVNNTPLNTQPPASSGASLPKTAVQDNVAFIFKMVESVLAGLDIPMQQKLQVKERLITQMSSEPFHFEEKVPEHKSEAKKNHTRLGYLD